MSYKLAVRIRVGRQGPHIVDELEFEVAAVVSCW